MSQDPVSIPKNPELKPAEDYYRLRKEGIGFIAEMSNRLWTDYNTHDPGITILEALCYAITDLAFRTGWDIKDILAPKTKSPDANQPFPDQPFFTARDILTVNPSTADDFRKLLIDCDLVRNAWVFCNAYTCDLNSKTVELLGLYEILLELEADPELGDLNDYKVEHNHPLFDAEGIPHPVTLELRFPKWGLENPDKWKLFLDSNDAFESKNGASFTLASSLKLNRTGTAITDNTDLGNNWRKVFYVTFEITLSNTITIDNVALRIFGDATAKKNATVDAFETLLNDKTPTGIIQRYRNKLKKIEDVICDAKSKLHSHRNLDEDYSRVKIVSVEDVAVCADVEVAADADIDWVQAAIWFEIEQYFNPPVPIYTLQELIKDKVQVEDIFNGPKLDNGFIKTEELEKAGLKKELRTSDIINRLMDIKGVVSVSNLLLSKYDSEGNPVTGAVSWLLIVSERHQPRLYRKLSRFLFKKNGLPFLPHEDEAYATLIQLRGEAERPKIKTADKDLPVPEGTFRNPDDYYPLQYSFPLTYGIGTEGLPSHVSNQRRAQAKQLKAYLMVFEQILGNAFAQLARTADLFSLDPLVERTYFVREFCKEVIQGYDEITTDLNKAKLEQMTETEPEFHKRRNRFLNHIMARFGEQFNEYALLLANLEGEQVALDRLIEEKISFLKVYPLISSGRGKAFDYKNKPCSPANQPGLQRRIRHLLGFACSKFEWITPVPGDPGSDYTVKFYLLDEDGKKLMNGAITVSAGNESEAKQLALGTITARMKLPSAYKTEEIAQDKKFQVILTDTGGTEIARTVAYFDSLTDAQAFIGGRIDLKINLEYILNFNLLDEDGKKLMNGAITVSAGNESAAKQSAFKKITARMKLPGAYTVREAGEKFDTILTKEGGVDIIARVDNFESEAAARAFIGKLILFTPHSWSDNERFIIVEHLLLRPKFPGDAMYPVSASDGCESCEADPYSFRLTFVMPGWAAPFDSNMELRRFADRTIQYETPAHLLPKICWVGNDGFILNPLDPVRVKLAEILKASGATAYQLDEAANTCAAKIHEYFWEKFHKSFIEREKTGNWLKDEWLVLLEKFEGTKSSDVAFLCAVPDNEWPEIKAIMLDYFTQIALSGWQFERFEEAWNLWLKANSKIDWTEVHLQERVEALLKDGLDPSDTTSTESDLRQCAANILGDYGSKFYEWMKLNIAEGKSWPDFPFDMPKPVISDCNSRSVSVATKQEIEKLLVGEDNNKKGLYPGWIEVSYRLWILLDLLSKLRNIYPGATLHDCDEGNDQNPVRLGSTALGNSPLHQASPLSTQSTIPFSDLAAGI